MRISSSKSRLLATAAILASLALAGCATTASTGSVGANSAPRTEAEWRRDVAIWGERYQKDQKDAEAAIRYAQALRATGQRAQAVAVLEQASMYHTRNTAVLGAYGRALALLKREGRCPSDVEHRQIKYRNNVIECDHGKLKRIIGATLGFKSMKTAYATIKGIEVMRALRKGQASAFYYGDPLGEMRLVSRVFEM